MNGINKLTVAFSTVASGCSEGGSWKHTGTTGSALGPLPDIGQCCFLQQMLEYRKGVEDLEEGKPDKNHLFSGDFSLS